MDQTELRHSNDWRICVFQVAAAALLVPAFAMAPPMEGAFLLVPLLPNHSPAALAVGRGASILSAGPTRNSLIVRGRLGALAGPLLADGILTLGAPVTICGAKGGA